MVCLCFDFVSLGEGDDDQLSRATKIPFPSPTVKKKERKKKTMSIVSISLSIEEKKILLKNPSFKLTNQFEDFFHPSAQVRPQKEKSENSLPLYVRNSSGKM
jgi:hypothetical protein